MNWHEYIHLDRRSKHPLDMQLEQGLIHLMHEELLLQPGQIINPEEISKQSLIPLEDVITVFQRLKAHAYLYEEKRTWKVSHHLFHRYYFTRPFEQKPTPHATPFTELILDQGWMSLPKTFSRFIPQPPSQVYRVREHFLHKGVGIGVSETFYLFPQPDVHQTPSLAALEKMRAHFTNYEREVAMMPRSKAMAKLLQPEGNNSYVLQGMYGLFQGQTCVVCGTVTTLTSYSYRNIKKTLPLTFLF